MGWNENGGSAPFVNSSNVGLTSLAVLGPVDDGSLDVSSKMLPERNHVCT